MGCIKLGILDQQYKRTELKVSYCKKELNFIIRGIFLLLIVSGCHINNRVTLELFNPNPLLKPADVYNSNLVPYPVDMGELFEFVSNDTITRIGLSEKMVYAQYWQFSINDTVTIDDIEFFFEHHYDVITLSRDTAIYDYFYIIGIKAYSKRNKLHFNYYIDYVINEHEIDRCVFVSYYFHSKTHRKNEIIGTEK